MKVFEKTAFLKGDLKDTLFFIEGYTIETRKISGRIWLRNHKVDYHYDDGDLVILDTADFTQYQMSLISKWDKIKIKEEEKSILFDSRILKATKCWKEAGKLKIDEIWFKDFFNPKRD